jgi:hypothetical protein
MGYFNCKQVWYLHKIYKTNRNSPFPGSWSLEIHCNFMIKNRINICCSWLRPTGMNYSFHIRHVRRFRHLMMTNTESLFLFFVLIFPGAYHERHFAAHAEKTLTISVRIASTQHYVEYVALYSGHPKCKLFLNIVLWLPLCQSSWTVFCLHRQSAYACSDSAPDYNLLRG